MQRVLRSPGGKKDYEDRPTNRAEGSLTIASSPDPLTHGTSHDLHRHSPRTASPTARATAPPRHPTPRPSSGSASGGSPSASSPSWPPSSSTLRPHCP